MSDSTIVCPHCHQVLAYKEETNYCIGCSRSFTYKHGILDFIPEDDFYWGEIDLPKMRQINEQVRKENWYSVISQLLPEKLGYIVDPGRLGWLFHCYDPDSNQACLDLGSGWGSLTFYLKDLYKTMYSQDGVIERLEFQALRADSENVHNIRFLRSDFQRIPLPDNSVDLVVLNGVLEWVALRDSHHKPEEIQLDFLVEIRRVLKSEGVVYLGIENRLGAQYFLGGEDHSGYPFTSLLPRAIANLFIKVVAKTGPKNNNSTHVFSNIEPGYRTYTYTKWGYQKLLYLAGFPKISFLWTWPGYSYPRLSGPLDAESVRYVLENMGVRHRNPLIRLLVKLGQLLPNFVLSWIIQLFSPHFLIFASTGSSQGRMQTSILDKEPHTKSFVRTSLGSNQSIKSTYLLLDGDGITRSVNLELQDNSNHRNLYSLQESGGIKGHLLRSHKKSEVIAAAKWLAEFQQDTVQGMWSVAALRKEISEITNSVKVYPYCNELLDELMLFEQKYLQQIPTTKVPIVTEHGDFTPANIVVGANNKITPIDWEYTQDRGNPLLDIGAFALSLLRFSSHNGALPSKITPRNPFYWFIHHFDNQFGIPICLAPTYYLLRVINRFSGEELINPTSKYVFHTWMSLLQPALEIGNNLEEINHSP